MSTAQAAKHTSTKTLVAGMKVLLVSKGQTIGGGEIIAINGRTITLAQVAEHYTGADMAEPTFDHEELALDEHIIGRSLVAWEM